MSNSNPIASSQWQFWIDRGGTFTDIVAQRPDGSKVIYKLLSENADRYPDAPLQGIRELMGIPSDAPLPADQIAVIKMGTTVATNALLERRGDRMVLITTQGFRDGLRIGYQNRPDIFARQIVLPEMLYDSVIEVPERMSATGEVLKPVTPDEIAALEIQLQEALQNGIQSCAIVFLHGDRYPDHEKQIAALAKHVGFSQVSVSHQVSPLIKWVSRGDTTVVDAYLSPILRRYVDRIEAAFQGDRRPQLLFMQSNGGLIPADYFQGKDSILSGPAGGMVGAVQTSQAAGFNQIITFDMGGTSTDVAHFDGSQDKTYERVLETEVAGVRLRSPMMAIHTVAAGGGSILHFDGSRYQVGPASAGAHPGPACYRRAGPLTVTDCNVMVGKIQPTFFPQVFGPEGNESIDRACVLQQFETLAQTIGQATGQIRTPEQVAEGFLSIAIDNMANAIKKISVQRGYDIGDYALCCFGAAGGQHACRLAEVLGMKTIVIHPYAGVLSAYGMGLADRRILRERSVEIELTEAAMPWIQQGLATLIQDCESELDRQGKQDITSIDRLNHLHLRYTGTDSTLMVNFASLPSMQKQFEDRYQNRFGIRLTDQKIMVSMISVELVGKTMPLTVMPTLVQPINNRSVEHPTVPHSTVSFFSENQWHDAKVYSRQALQVTEMIVGPAIILETTGTNIIEPGWCAVVESGGVLVLTHQPQAQAVATIQPIASGTTPPDPVRLEIFKNLFQSIAEQMGFTLQNTSSSVNIKERLDFSCAIFDAHGGLVANAPHIPVHLGSMGESVSALIASQSASHSEPFQPGDVFISNNPYNGGTHLPDITAITPVFDTATQPLFFVASRGHHADIGGITPGSMPPHSQNLSEEGILFDNVQLVRRNVFQEADLRNRLAALPHPARNPNQNMADLQAQIAANRKGEQELQQMVKQFGLQTVQHYMQHVQDNAEQAVRSAIQQLAHTREAAGESLTSSYQVPMDCGATIAVAITLNPMGTATIDFTGTSLQQPNNFNAPLAVCKAAVLYVFRSLVETPIPLNAGCLKPLDIRVPAASLLNPHYPAAVVAGNVETSQTVTDSIYAALGVLASSQGTMNNFTFGNDQVQYYETICGGSGAGPGFAGCDAVQTHMTNSRLTDPEILELRFPVLLESFSIRSHSGGVGQYPGGNGVIRRIQFRSAMTANILSGRRSTVPFGLAGGGDGLPGCTSLKRQDGTRSVLSYIASVKVEAGDCITIETPGGGGYG